MSDEEIDKMIKDAEMNAEADKKRKEEVDTRNQADSLVFQVEKTLSEAGDKIDPTDKENVEKAKDELKAALDNNASTEELKTKSDALTDALYKITEKMYAAAQAAQQAQAGAQGGEAPHEDGVYDAEYTEVKDEQ